MNLESKAGQVFVNLRVGLGQTQPQPLPPSHPFHGPARLRRRQRRADARRAADQAKNASQYNAEEAPVMQKLWNLNMKLKRLQQNVNNLM